MPVREQITNWVRANVLQRALERRYNVETERPVMLEDLGLDAPGRLEYRPTPWRAFKQMLPRDEVGRDDVFCDLGCGMGRAVLLAARYPFKRVIGVELAPELADIARRNVEQVRAKVEAGDVEIVTADATAYPIPDDLTVLYLYNPFTGEIFDRVLENLLASVDRAPRRLRVIYRHPTEHEKLEASGRFERVRTIEPKRRRGRSSTAETRVYEVRPAT